jgi:hypothetical protein
MAVYVSQRAMRLNAIVCTFVRRAPVLVAIALIENGQDALTAVSFIRQKRYDCVVRYQSLRTTKKKLPSLIVCRRGAINAIQLGYLENYVPKSKLAPKGCGCAIM